MNETTYVCPICNKDSGTYLVHPECISLLNDSQFEKINRLWHEEVCYRDDFYCTYCGDQFLPVDSDDPSSTRKVWYVCGDHIKQKLTYPGERFNVANGRCTCKPCHTIRHQGHLSPHKSMSQNKKDTAEKKSKVKKAPICKEPGCPIWATGKDGKCFKHTKKPK